MSATQISVVIENLPGKALEVFGALASAKVDVRAVSVADTADLGVVRLIVADEVKAKTALKKKGLAFTIAPVVPVIVHDKPGALAQMLKPLAKKQVNIEYLYGTTCGCGQDACDCGCGPEGCDSIIVIRAKDVKKAEATLKAAGYKIAKL